MMPVSLFYNLPPNVELLGLKMRLITNQGAILTTITGGNMLAKE